MLKRWLVASRIGPLMLDRRDRAALHSAARHNIEGIGDAANDIMARLLLERLCLPGRTFIDVGAHIGSVISGVRRRSNPGKIIAFEAIPEKARLLRQLFRDVEIHDVALGDHHGEADFYVDELRPGFSSLNAALVEQSRTHRITVPVRILDDIVAPDGIDIVKIDVEGAELGVLRGAERLTASSRPTFIFESGPEVMGSFTLEALWRWFEERNYCIMVPNRVAHLDNGLTCEMFVEAHLYPRRTTNYVAIAAERRMEVRARARELLKLS